MIEAQSHWKTGHEATTDVPILEQRISLDRKSLLSGIRSDDEKGKYAHLEGVMRSVFGDITRNPDRQAKYKRFITTSFAVDRLWRLANLPNPENRFRAFLLIYAQSRLFDDIIDGDTPQKIPPQDRVAYAEKRLNNLWAGTFDPSDSIDALSIKILSDIQGIDPNYEAVAKKRLGQIMGSIAFDGGRVQEKGKVGSWKLFTRSELEKHFFDLDIEGVIGLTLFLFGFKDSDKNRDLLTPLGQAARVSYNVKDFSQDIGAGLCNIPEEDAEQFHITQADLEAVLRAKGDYSGFPLRIRDWLQAQTATGRELLRCHGEQDLSSLEMQGADNKLYRGIVTHGVLNAMYVLPARLLYFKTDRRLQKT